MKIYGCIYGAILLSIAVALLATTASAEGPPSVAIISPSAGNSYCGTMGITAHSWGANVSGVSYKVSGGSGDITGWVPMSIYSGDFFDGYWNGTYGTSALSAGYYTIAINATGMDGSENSTESAQFYLPAAIAWSDSDSSGTDSINDTVTVSNGDVVLVFRYQSLNTGTASENGYSIDTLSYKGETLLENTPYYEQNKLNHDITKTNYLMGVSQIIGSKGDNPDVFQALWSASKTYYNLYQNHAIVSDGCSLTLYTASRSVPSYIPGTLTLGTETNFTLNGSTVRITDTVTNRGASAVNLTRLLTFPAPRLVTTFFSEPLNRNNNPYGATYVRKIRPTAYSDNYTAYVENFGSNSYGSGTLEIDDNTGDNPPWSAERALFIPAIYVLNTTTLASSASSVMSADLVLSLVSMSSYYGSYLSGNGIGFDDFNYAQAREYFTSRARVDQSFHSSGFAYTAYYSDQTTPPVGPSDWNNIIIGKSLMAMYYDTMDDYYLNRTKGHNNYLVNSLLFTWPSDWKYGYFKDATKPGVMISWKKNVTAYMWSQPYQLQGMIAEYMSTGSSARLNVIMNNIRNVYNSNVAGGDGGLWNQTAYRWKWLIQNETSKKSVDQDNFDSQAFGINAMLQAYMLTGNSSYLERAVNVTEKYSYVLQRPAWMVEDTRKVNSFNVEMFTAKTLYLLYDMTGTEKYKTWAGNIVDNVIYSSLYMDNFPQEYTWLKGGVGRMSHDWGNPTVPASNGDSGLFSEYNLIPWMQEGLIAAYKHTGDEKYVNFSKQLLSHIMNGDARRQSIRMVDFFENSNVSWSADASCSTSLSGAVKKMDSYALDWNFQNTGLTGDKGIYRVVSGSGTSGFADWSKFDNVSFWFYTTDPGKTYKLSIMNSGSWSLLDYNFTRQLSSGWTLVNVTLPSSRSNVQQVRLEVVANEWSTGTFDFFVDDMKLVKNRVTNLSAEYNAYTDLWYDYDNGQGIVGNLFVLAEMGALLNGSRAEQSELLLLDRGNHLLLINPFYNYTFSAKVHLKRPFAHLWNKAASTLTGLNSGYAETSTAPGGQYYFLNATFTLSEADSHAKLLDEGGALVDNAVDIYVSGSSSKNATNAFIPVSSSVDGDAAFETIKFNTSFEPDSMSYASATGAHSVNPVEECGTGACFSHEFKGTHWEVTVYGLAVEQGTNNITCSGPAYDVAPPVVAITYPANATYYNVTYFDFSVSETAVCWYGVDGGANVSIPSCQNGTSLSLSQGQHVLEVYANDTAGNLGMGQAVFKLDQAAPYINSLAPPNNTVTSDTTPDFNFTSSDNVAATTDCMLWMDNGTKAPYGRNSAVPNNTLVTITANQTLSAGNYWWWINCTDGINSAASAKRNISITAATPCWQSSYAYLDKTAAQASKFCKCAMGTYGYTSYTADTKTRTSYYYTDTADNTNWGVSSHSYYRPIKSVKCTNGLTYSTASTYYYGGGAKLSRAK